MAKQAQVYKVAFGGVDRFSRDELVPADALGEQGNIDRLLRLGAIVEAEPAEVEAWQRSQDGATDADGVRPFTAGAPIGYPGPRDDPDGTIAAATRQGDAAALQAAADVAAPDAEPKKGRK